MITLSVWVVILAVLVFGFLMSDAYRAGKRRGIVASTEVFLGFLQDMDRSLFAYACSMGGLDSLDDEEGEDDEDTEDHCLCDECLAACRADEPGEPAVTDAEPFLGSRVKKQ